ncbi:MAG: hypothetical protein ABIL14_05080, partial [candidate division WOR-3 bacterium]
MRGIKINKIAAVGLLMVLVVCGSYASKEGMTREGAEVDLTLSGMPKLNEIFEVRATIIGKKGLDEYAYYFPTYEFMATLDIFSKERESVKILGKNEIYIPELRNEWTKELKFRLQIVKKIPYISIICHLYPIRDFRMGRVTQVADAIELYLLDSLTGQYGTREEYERGLSVEYRYDFVDGSFIGRYDQSRVSLEENRRIIKMMKELEPSLTDSLALLLHSEQYKVGVPKGTAKWDSLNQRWIDKGVYEYYLKDGWLKAVQDGRLMEWEENEKVKIQKEWKGGKGFNFFRIDNNTPPDLHGGDCLTKTFDGYWKFKDHLYNKDQGLLVDAIKKPVKNARARIYITYQISGVPYRYVSEQCITNENGYFSITTELPNSFELGKAFAVVYPAGGGPDTATPVINVSDPNPHQPSYKRDPFDPTLYVILNLYYKEFYPNSLPVHFDTVYADTYPAVGQPESGCLNIYETYLHARTFTTPPPTWPLRV